jgi:adenine/guanine phosphoribosyltransferase-like PRPP-binding protein
MKLALTHSIDHTPAQTAQKHEHASAFSRAVHFLMAVTPMGIGVAFVLVQDFMRTGQAKSALIALTLWLVGVGFAILLLRAMDDLADADRSLDR